MAGYLRSLAEGVLDVAPRLHAAAALPYSQSRELLPSRLEFLPEQMSGDSSSEPRISGDEPAFQARRESEMSASASTQSEPGMLPLPSPSRQGTPAYDEPAPPLPRAIKHRFSSPGDVQAPMPLQPAQPPASHAAERAVATANPASAELAAKTSHRERAQPKSPTPLASTRISPLRREAAPTIPAAKVEPAPEVHIHIGRIELTAVSPPVAKPRESAPTKKPMSLDDYLQHRRAAKDGTGTP